MSEDSYFDQQGYNEYEKMESKDTANAIKKLAALEKYYIKIANKYSKLNQYYLGKCRISHYFPSIGEKQSEECLTINSKITRFKNSFFDPISQEISQIRQRIPFLSIPLSGGEFGSSACFTGIVDDFASQPLSYLIYGSYTPLKKAAEFNEISKDLHFDMQCGTPAWKGAADSGEFSYNVNQSSLNPSFNTEYESLRDYTHPDILREAELPDISVLNDIIGKEFDPTNPRSEINKFEKFMESYSQQPPPTSKEIRFAKKLKAEADIGIEDAFLKTLNDACSDPYDYGKELLLNDSIGKIYFQQKYRSNSEKKLFCEARSNFIEEERSRDRNYTDASIGIGILGFMHPVVALVALPIELGLEYAQFNEMQVDRRRNLSLALFGLEDYQKAEEEIETLKSEELFFYGVIGAMALGGAGDLVDAISTAGKAFSRYRTSARRLEGAINTFSPASKRIASEFNESVNSIQASGNE